MKDQSQCFSFFTLQRADKDIQNIVCGGVKQDR